MISQCHPLEREGEREEGRGWREREGEVEKREVEERRWREGGERRGVG